ncbi:hypothetical protein F511_44749 [Dorcoceras hygrometricum]|uniref:Uncharacterized protein n=1 Tax=Dorcoceras hygrometricum TaxID=472368 RepID=A0A2Z7CLP6_9LAMI|nr:hypothetical protein F511_44749 [Dorcoceras hygrometricum]
MVTPGTKQAKGFAVQISLLLEKIPNLDLGESSEFPASKILTDKTMHCFISLNDKAGAAEATGAPKPKAASKKRRAADVGAAVAKKKRTTKKRVSLSKVNLDWMAVAQEAVPIQMIEGSTAPAADNTADQPTAVDVFPADRPAEEIDSIERIDEQLIAEPAVEVSRISSDSPADQVDEEVPWFVHSFLRADRDNERLFETGSDSENAMYIEDNSQDLPVVRDTCVSIVGEQEITAFGEQLLGTNDESSEDIKAEEPVEKSADEFFDDDEARSLQDILLSIPVDVPLPYAGMEITKIVMGNEIKIPEVTERTWFLNSLPKIPSDHKGKAILVEKDPIKANLVQENYFLINAYIDLLVELRAKIIDEVAQFFNSFSLKKLETINIEEMYKKEEKVLSWGETESPQLAIQRKLYILLKYREVLVRKFLESWKSNFVPGQGSSAVDLRRQYDDTLPSVSKFFRMMRKRWADVCLEVAEFCASRRLLPVGSINFCRALEIVEPDSRVDYRQPTVFSLRLSQFCTVHIQYSLFSRLTTEDITDFLSSIALERTVLRSVQNSIVSADVPHVQLSLVQDQSSSSTAASSSSLNFDATDLDASVSSLPTVSIDFSAALADFQAILLAQIDESQSGISSRLHKIEQSLCDSLRDQADIFKNLSQGARQEARTIDDVQTLRFNEFRNHVLAQNASIFTGLEDVRKEVQEVNAKVDILASRLNVVQQDVEATKEPFPTSFSNFKVSQWRIRMFLMPN